MILNTPEAKIAHLLRRTGFTATHQQVNALKDYRLEEIVDQLLDAPHPAPIPPANLGKDQHKELVMWWVDVLAHTTNPLLEKMTLFWHGHFTSAFYKVRELDLMAQQNVLLRRHALGNFRALCYDISVDPAMLLWLDNNTNQKKSPNENYARELLELFTLGIGHYSEQDIKEAARALTGWRVRKDDTKAVFVNNQHDNGQKTIFGQTGNWGLQEMVDLILAQPACATFIATKLWSFFSYPNPEPAVIEPLAQAFVQSGFEIKPLLKQMLTCEAFYSDQAYRALVKHPTEFIIGLLALFPKYQPKDNLVLQGMNLMGQILFDPPNVAGWPSGAAWLNASMLFARFNFAEQVLESVSHDDLSALPDVTGQALLQACQELTGLTDLSANTKQQLTTYLSQTRSDRDTLARGLLHLLLLCPEAQLK